MPTENEEIKGINLFGLIFTPFQLTITGITLILGIILIGLVKGQINWKGGLTTLVVFLLGAWVAVFFKKMFN